MPWPAASDVALPMEAPLPRKSFPPPPHGSLTSCSLGPPALLFLYRLAAVVLSLLITIPTLVPRLRDSPAASEAYRYSADVRTSALFYSTWSLYLTVLYFSAAAVASGERVGWRVAEWRRRRKAGRSGGGGGPSPDAAAAARADAGPASAVAIALLHAAAPAAAFVCFSTFFVVLPAAAATGSQEAVWAVVGTLATPLGLAAAGGGLAALTADLALSRVLFPRPRYLLLTTAWPATFLAIGAAVAAVHHKQSGGGPAPVGDPSASSAAPPSPAPSLDADWGSAAAKQLSYTLIAHLVAAVGLGCVAWVREGVCAAGAAVAKRVKGS